MAEHVIVRRPTQDAVRGEITEYLRTLGRALEEIGVGYGEQFAVVPASAFEQKGLDEVGGLGPFVKDSETSRKAALDNYPRQGSQRWRILQQLALREDHGATRDELAAVLSIPDSSADARVGELRDAGFIEETDRTRRTRHGSEATILAISEKGTRELREHDDDLSKGSSTDAQDQ